jgi:AbrB family looped-hinge helix DNA binding protein
MAVIKIGPKHQITIPKEIFKKLSLEVGDVLEAKQEGEAIYLVPQKLIPKEQAWFWTKEWQEKEREAEGDIKRGRVKGPFKDISSLLKSLKAK